MIPNSLTAHIYHDNLVLCGGPHTDRLWYLNILTLEWHEELCSGVFPPPTQFSASAVCGSKLYLCGGELLPTNPADVQKYPRTHHELLELFVLDLITLEWQTVPCPWKPRSRSHHTLTAIDSSTLLLLGGKPQGEEVTSHQVRELMVTDFYAVHLFDIVSGVWHIFSQAPLPCLWGHSVNIINDAAVVIYGGFETTLEMDENSRELPTIAVNTYLRYLNVRTMACYHTGSRVPSRVLHQSHMCGDELYILGGLSVDETHLSLVPHCDAIKISLTTFECSLVTFCLQYWPLESIVSTVYKNQLIVLNKADDIFVLCGSKSVWDRHRCDTTTLTTLHLIPINNSKQETSKTTVTRSLLDLPLSKPSVSPILLEMLQHLGYPM